MGYNHSIMNRRLWTAGASNVVTRLAARSITGPIPPIQVHQHYGLELHLVLAGDSCIRRACFCAADMCRLSTQLEKRLEGLCSCVFAMDHVPPCADKVGVVGPYLHHARLELPVTVLCMENAPLARWIPCVEGIVKRK